MDSSNYLPQKNRNYFWLAIISLAALEVMTVSLLVDARGILSNGVASGILYFAGDFLKWLIVAAAIFMLCISSNLKSADAELARGAKSSRLYWSVPLHLFCFICFLTLTRILFSGTFEADNLHFFLWASLTSLTALTFAVLATPLSNLLSFLSKRKIALLISMIAGLAVLIVSLYSRILWEPLTNFTFHGSYIFLDLIYDDIFIDVPGKLLGANGFIVNVSPQCSGIEGMALAIAISSAYLYFSRESLVFPRAILLIPIAAILALLFNVLRVASLITIGASFSPEIAVGGFHSVAGWIGSVMIAMLIIFVFSSWSSFRAEASLNNDKDERAAHESDLATAILLPFVLFMAATLIAGIFGGKFDYLYPVKLALPFLALILFWRKYNFKMPSNVLEPLIIGAIVAVLWVLLTPENPEANHVFQTHLMTMPIWALITWLLFRLLGFWIFAPVVEELVFRCYLINRIGGVDLKTQGRIAFSVLAFLVTSILFGLIHANWIAGIVAGALFAVARYRSDTITTPIVAHASANIFVGIWAMATQNWILI